MSDAIDIPDRQLWAKARTGPLTDLPMLPAPPLRAGESVAFIGGKLAVALVQPLADAGFPQVVSDRRHPVLTDIPAEDLEYEMFGHGYGEVHTAREFRQLVERAARTFKPTEDRWRNGVQVVDPFRPGLRYAAVTDQEFDVLQERHLNTMRTTFRRAGTLIVSLSQSEIWESKADGAVFPRRPAAAETYFDPEKHAVRSLTIEETILDLLAAIRVLRTLNPDVVVVLMVSPEPQQATTHPAHVALAGSVGKAILRLAMETVSAAEGVVYFPALEIAGLIAPTNEYGADGSVPDAVVEVIAGTMATMARDIESYRRAASPIAALRTIPEEAKPKRPRRPAPAEAAEPSEPVPSAPPPRKAKPKASLVTAVDAYTEAKAHEAAEKAKRRAAHYAELGQVPPPEPEPETPAKKQAQRQAMRREKALARGVRPDEQTADQSEVAVAPAGKAREREKVIASPPAASEPSSLTKEEKRRQKREHARERLPAAAAATEADSPDKARRKMRKDRANATEQPTDTAVVPPSAGDRKPRRERKRAAKG